MHNMTALINACRHQACIRCTGLLLSLLLTACSSTPDPRIHSPNWTNAQTRPVDRPGKLLAIVRKQIGQPYRYGGNQPGGFDCSGLAQYGHRQLGIKIPRTTRQLYAHASMRNRESLRPGDLIFFRINGRISHLGIYAGNGHMIHAPSSGKYVRKDSIWSPYWKSRYAGAANFL